MTAADDEAARRWALRVWSDVGTPVLLEAQGSAVEEQAAADVARLLALLHVPAPAGFRPLGQVVQHRLARAEAERRTSPAKLAWAYATLAELEREPPTPVLLHGNLDPRNLLVRDREGLVAVDPVPCAGDPAYDAAYWVHSGRQPGRRTRLEALLAATGLPRERVRDWAGVIGVHG